MIIIEQFDSSKFTTEKVSFAISVSNKVFHVGEGNGMDDGLWCSPLWKNQLTTEELRKRFWEEIKRYLPRYQSGKLQVFGGQPRWYRGVYFRELMRIVEASKQYSQVKLIYINDREHCEMIKRCVEWLATQI